MRSQWDRYPTVPFAVPMLRGKIYTAPLNNSPILLYVPRRMPKAKEPCLHLPSLLQRIYTRTNSNVLTICVLAPIPKRKNR